MRFFLASLLTLSAFAAAIGTLGYKAGVIQHASWEELLLVLWWSSNGPTLLRDFGDPNLVAQMPVLKVWGALAFGTFLYVFFVLVFKRGRDFRDADTMAWVFVALTLVTLYMAFVSQYPVMMMIPAWYVQAGIILMLLFRPSRARDPSPVPVVVAAQTQVKVRTCETFEVRSLVFSPDGRMNRVIYLAASLTFGTLFFWFMASFASLFYQTWRGATVDVQPQSPRLVWELGRAGFEIMGMAIIIGVVFAYRWTRLRLHDSHDPKMHDLLAMIYLAAAGAPVLLVLLPADLARTIALMALPQVIMMMMMSSTSNDGYRRLPVEIMELFGGKLPEPLASTDGPVQPGPPNAKAGLSNEALIRRAEALRAAEASNVYASNQPQPRHIDRTGPNVTNGGFGRRQGLSNPS
ncbi:MAG: hypothetical protein AAF890_09855 [Pseudomonadota bacterium]